jgi:hypothetical protein
MSHVIDLKDNRGLVTFIISAVILSAFGLTSLFIYSSA